jgi:hypothetical protein
MDVIEERSIEREEWQVKRIGHLSEVVMGDGSVKWRVRLQDHGRTPFVDKYFDRPDRAKDFFDRLKQEPGRVHERIAS